MKRYLLFFGKSYYPSGGMEDFNSDFEKLENAEIRAKELINKVINSDIYTMDEVFDYYWYSIYDLEAKEFIYKSYE